MIESIGVGAIFLFYLFAVKRFSLIAWHYRANRNSKAIGLSRKD